jgi:hypothetical protein
LEFIIVVEGFYGILDLMDSEHLEFGILKFWNLFFWSYFQPFTISFLAKGARKRMPLLSGLGNIFTHFEEEKEELNADSVVRKFRTTESDGKNYQTFFLQY